MKIAVLGGGFAGISASFYTAKEGHKVTLFEKEPQLGGLAVGFKQSNWDWFIEKAVHHWFTNDLDMQSFAKEIGFNKIIFKTPLTASLYDNSRIIPLDSPQDLLKFPYLPMYDKLRAGLVLTFIKLSPFFSFYERETAQEFLRKTMGGRAWEALWKDLFRKKFGKYAGNIVASFIWARIKKRTRKLGYPEGGFQKLLDQAEKKINELKVEIKKGIAVEKIERKGEKFIVHTSEGVATFDAIISTLPTPILIKLTEQVFPKNYLENLKGIKYQHAISLIIESKEPFLEKAYWINMADPSNPIMGIFQHTNFMDKKHFAGNHILYVGNYVDFDDPLVKMSDKEILDYYLPHLKKINPQFVNSLIRESFNYFVFKGPFAQPIFDKDFLKRKPDFETPVKNFFIANLDMTYPYDRGTNYAVKLGREVAKLV